MGVSNYKKGVLGILIEFILFWAVTCEWVIKLFIGQSNVFKEIATSFKLLFIHSAGISPQAHSTAEPTEHSLEG